MNYSECMDVVDKMNKLYPNWFKWATAKAWTWDKLLLITNRYEYRCNADCRDGYPDDCVGQEQGSCKGCSHFKLSMKQTNADLVF